MRDYYLKRDDILRAGFNAVAEEYEANRLSYPIELFNDIRMYAKEVSNALEIGIGTGKGTRPFLEAGINVTAIEPNEKMAQIAIDKNKSFGNLKVIICKFEEAQIEQKYDLVYAASSFQWIKSMDRMSMIRACLRDGGCFAKFKTVTIVNPDSSEGSKCLFEVYESIIPEFLPKEQKSRNSFQKESIDAGFIDIRHKDYYQNYIFDGERYIRFMRTYTEYNALEQSIRDIFEDAVRKRIQDKEIIITQKCTLDLATAK